MKRKKPRPGARSTEQSIDELIAEAARFSEQGALADAEARYRHALTLAPEHLGVLTLLGLLLVERDDAHGAIDLLERARDLAAEFAPIQLALGSAYAAAGYDELAVVAMETAGKLDTASTVPLERLAKHHIAARRSREAIGVLRRILRREPAHADARFLLSGLTGEVRSESALVESPPSALIADLFDTYAPRFDKHLVEQLAYRVPASLATLIADLGATADGSWRVIDLGCGTGLAGVAFRAYAQTLIGSDLSPRMIARARARGIYDELVVEDLVATLERHRDVDLVVAADVFIYVGVLDATFAAAAAALRPGGLFAFSVERSLTEDVVLQATLRYAHSDAYLRGLATAHGFTIERAEPTILRVDSDQQPVHGTLYVLRRRTDS